MLSDDKLQELVKRYLNNAESVQRVIENLSGRKVFEYLSGLVNKQAKNVTHEEFTDLMSRHHHEHHQH
jgi:hypothetical protein